MDKKLTVMDMAKYLSVSKEAIYNRLRRGTLEAVTEDGKKYVLLTSNVQREGRLPKRAPITNTMDSEYIDLLKSQIEELKHKNEKLEDDRDRLYREKENMLIESKQMIEKVYKERDEQLKTILTLANVPTLGHKLESNEPIEVVEEIEIEEDIVEQMCESFGDWELLNDRFYQKGFTVQEQKKITKKVKKQLGKSLHVKISYDEIYIKKDIKLKKIIGKK
ncbi:MAG TPA: integrase [Sulfurospirillum arcachonense]|nr:integrase [Sulfurospirillum arcachonense]